MLQEEQRRSVVKDGAVDEVDEYDEMGSDTHAPPPKIVILWDLLKVS